MLSRKRSILAACFLAALGASISVSHAQGFNVTLDAEDLVMESPDDAPKQQAEDDGGFKLVPAEDFVMEAPDDTPEGKDDPAPAEPPQAAEPDPADAGPTLEETYAAIAKIYGTQSECRIDDASRHTGFHFTSEGDRVTFLVEGIERTFTRIWPTRFNPADIQSLEIVSYGGAFALRLVCRDPTAKCIETDDGERSSAYVYLCEQSAGSRILSALEHAKRLATPSPSLPF